MLKLPNKDPEERLDYPVDFAALLPAGYAIDSANCVIESMDPAASPQGLKILSVLTASGGQSSPTRTDTVILWLEGGIKDTTYVLKITASDSQNVPHDRQYVRRAKIKIKEK